MTEAVGGAHSLALILVCALVTLCTRAIPFVLFPGKKELPGPLAYLGRTLQGAVMGMLAVYCFRNTAVLTRPYALPEIISAAATVGLYLWKKNILLSVASGTVIYGGCADGVCLIANPYGICYNHCVLRHSSFSGKEIPRTWRRQRASRPWRRTAAPGMISLSRRASNAASSFTAPR